MNREEAKEFLIDVSYSLGNMSVEYLSEKDGEKMREAIEVLEQETILGKIRAEIEQHRRKTQGIDTYDLVGDCLDIIDKYKAESEDKE